MIPRVLAVTLAALAVLLGGCAGKEIRREAEVRRALATAPLPPAPPLKTSTQGPYQMSLRLSEAILDRLAFAALAPRLDARHTASELGAAPYLRAENVHITVGGCAGCLALRMELEMGVSPAGDGLLGTLVAEAAGFIRTTGELMLEGRLAIDATAQGGPALIIDGLQVTGVRLVGAVEADVSVPRQLIQAGLRQAIDQALSQHPEAPSLALPSSLNIAGEHIPLTALAVHTQPARAGHPGEVVIGLNSALPAAGTLLPQSGPPLRPGEWGLSLSEPLMEAALSRSLARGSPALGPVYDVRSFTVDRDGLGVALRLWHTGRRPYRQDYGLTWRPDVSGGQAAPRDLLLSMGEGDGASRRAPQGAEANDMAQLVLKPPHEAALRAGAWAAVGSLPAVPTLERIALSEDHLTIIGRLRVEMRRE